MPQWQGLRAGIQSRPLGIFYEVSNAPACIGSIATTRWSVMTVSIGSNLNEIDGVQAILPQIRPGGTFDQLVVVDGGSRDGTVEWCREHGYEVFAQRRRGIRYAYLDVLSHLTGDIILTLN